MIDYRTIKLELTVSDYDTTNLLNASEKIQEFLDFYQDAYNVPPLHRSDTWWDKAHRLENSAGKEALWALNPLLDTLINEICKTVTKELEEKNEEEQNDAN